MSTSMQPSREQWEQDIQARQRNVVFPDTVQNETRFWRNIIGAKQRLTRVQIIGIGLLYLLIGAILWSDAADRYRSAASGSVWDQLKAAFGIWVVLFVAFGILFIILRWRVRRALREIPPRKFGP